MLDLQHMRSDLLSLDSQVRYFANLLAEIRGIKGDIDYVDYSEWVDGQLYSGIPVRYAEYYRGDSSSQYLYVPYTLFMSEGGDVTVEDEKRLRKQCEQECLTFKAAATEYESIQQTSNQQAKEYEKYLLLRDKFESESNVQVNVNVEI